MTSIRKAWVSRAMPGTMVAMPAPSPASAIAARASEVYRLPRDLVLRLANCGAPDAWFNRISGELTLCYERIAYFRTLARELPKLRAGESPTPH